MTMSLASKVIAVIPTANLPLSNNVARSLDNRILLVSRSARYDAKLLVTFLAAVSVAASAATTSVSSPALAVPPEKKSATIDNP